MQGYVTDEKGESVKAAIVRLYKKCKNAEGQDPIDETDVFTYAETDGEGRFLIRDLDPEDEYIIEIHIAHSVPESVIADEAPVAADEEPAAAGEEPEAADAEYAVEDEESGYDEDDRIEDRDIVDSLAAKTLTDSTSRDTVCINCCCNYKAAVDLKAKPYLARTNLW